MGNGYIQSGGNFEVEHGPVAAEVTNVHNARDSGVVDREGEMWITSNTKIADKDIGCYGKR